MAGCVPAGRPACPGRGGKIDPLRYDRPGLLLAPARGGPAFAGRHPSAGGPDLVCVDQAAVDALLLAGRAGNEGDLGRRRDSCRRRNRSDPGGGVLHLHRPGSDRALREAADLRGADVYRNRALPAVPQLSPGDGVAGAAGNLLVAADARSADGISIPCGLVDRADHGAEHQLSLLRRVCAVLGGMHVDCQNACGTASNRVAQPPRLCPAPSTAKGGGATKYPYLAGRCGARMPGDADASRRHRDGGALPI